MSLKRCCTRKLISIGSSREKSPTVVNAWKVDPEVEKLLGATTRSHLITNFDAVADEVVRLA